MDDYDHYDEGKVDDNHYVAYNNNDDDDENNNDGDYDDLQNGHSTILVHHGVAQTQGGDVVIVPLGFMALSSYTQFLKKV